MTLYKSNLPLEETNSEARGEKVHIRNDSLGQVGNWTIVSVTVGLALMSFSIGVAQLYEAVQDYRTPCMRPSNTMDKNLVFKTLGAPLASFLLFLIAWKLSSNSCLKVDKENGLT